METKIEEKKKTSLYKWVSDPAHSEVMFRVKHLMITTVTGYFRKFEVSMETEGENFKTARNIRFTADVDSIDTNNPQRDEHLKSEDFFSRDKHGKIVFEGRHFEASGDDRAMLHGDLTIKGTTRPITLNVEFGGVVVDPYGQKKSGFSIDGKIRRKDFGLVWDAVTEAGKVVVSDEVKIHCDIQLVLQKQDGGS